MSRITIFMLGVAVALGSVASAAAQIQLLTLPIAEQQKLGIETVTLVEVSVAPSAPAFVRVLDPGALAALDADLTAASAAASASARERERLTRLYSQDASASRQAMEAAAAQAAVDAARYTALTRQMAIEWAPAIAGLKTDARSALIDDLVAGRAALLRADAHVAPDMVAKVTLSVAAETVASADVLGRAGAVNPRLQTLGVLAVLKGDAAHTAPPGLLVNGRVFETGEARGVVIPRSAVVRLDGDDWAYVKTAGETFERREIADAVRIDAGWFVAKGFAPGDAVVVRNAGSLLGAERADESAEAG